MCGIAGGLDRDKRDQTVREMMDAIAHRGPDDPPRIVASGSWTGGVCRLRITERRIGAQPAANASGTVIVSFNGEIYNYKALRKRLSGAGIAVEDDSECSLILAGYEWCGVDIFSMLDGMFAIAVYDSVRAVLCLARDRMGIKPLYVSVQKGGVYYSSEMKSFFAANLSKGEIDESYATYRRVFGFGPLDHTLFQDIAPLEPGTWRIYSVERPGATMFERRGQFSKWPLAVSERDDIRTSVIAAVRGQFPKEVPASVLLSGGLDSSIIAKCLMDDASDFPRLCTLADIEETADLVAAREVARSFGASLAEYRAPSASLELLFRYLLAREEFEISSLFWFVLAEGISRDTPVAISGQGADELFCGYPFHRDISQSSALFMSRWLKYRGHCPGSMTQRIDDQLEKLGSINGMIEFNRLFLREQLVWFQLDSLDKCSMAHGLEMRVPYLDQSLVEFVGSLPIASVYAGEKRLLRQAFKSDGIPTIDRPKQFAGRWTIPNLHRDILALCGDVVGGEMDPSYRYAWLVDGKEDAVCLEALRILLPNFSNRALDHVDVEDVRRMIGDSLRRPHA